MSAINLLPWRESEARYKQRSFYMLLGISCFMTLILCYAWNNYIDQMTVAQNLRNQYLQSEIAIVDQEIVEITNIKQQKAELIRRIELIQTLDQKRPLITRLFNRLPDITPVGVYIDSMHLSAGTVLVKGRAEDTSKVSEMLRNVEKEGWLNDVTLPSIISTQTQPVKLYHFSMHFVVMSEEEQI
ncbi:PilN domain-containing protein [Psychromonas aquatilis]|uniref:PilN domain-containing protein n=1 Tax=Psychromonas aquatilis TaxID=2005072 RepID=A0ABU9GM41_9GAMM